MTYHERYMPKLRVRYYDYYNGVWTSVESVLCSDLYAEKIELEMNGTINSTQFIDTFTT